MVKAFDPTKTIKAAQDRVTASQARQEKLAEALDKREKALVKSTAARDKAKQAVDDEKKVERMAQAFVDRNSTTEGDLDNEPGDVEPAVEGSASALASPQFTS